MRVKRRIKLKKQKNGVQLTSSTIFEAPQDGKVEKRQKKTKECSCGLTGDETLSTGDDDSGQQWLRRDFVFTSAPSLHRALAIYQTTPSLAGKLGSIGEKKAKSLSFVLGFDPLNGPKLRNLRKVLMAPSRKSRSVNKRLSNIREAASNKDKIIENVSKTRQHGSPGTQKKRKLTDMLGPPWSEDELEHFYEAYRKYGKDWKKVAVAVHNRSLEMVEALYNMNRAYLSLPEGTASVVGLIAMMTDHYSVLGGSDSGQESNEETETFKKPKKRLRGKCLYDSYKASDGHFSDPSQTHSVASSDGCLSLLQKKHSGIRPHAVRKRTPRVPVSYSYGKDARQNYRQMVDSNDVAHKIALALTEASQRGGSTKVSGTPNNKSKGAMPSPGQTIGRKHAKAEMAGAKFSHSDLNEGSSELSLGSSEGDDGEYSRKFSQLSGRESSRRGKNQEKEKRCHRKKLEHEENANKHLDDVKEASSGTDKGKRLGSVKSKIDTAFASAENARSSFKGFRKTSKKVLFEQDEGSSFDALKTLADLSLMMPVTNPDTESSVRVMEDKHDVIDGSKVEAHACPRDETAALSKLAKVSSDNGVSVSPAAFQLDAGMKKRRQKSLMSKATDEGNKSVVKRKRTFLSTVLSRQLKAVKHPGKMPSSTDEKGERGNLSLSPIKISSTNEVNLANKGRYRRKMEKPKPMVEQDAKVSENFFSGQHKSVPQNSSLNHKERLIHCLSSHQIRRWCTFEWFYSAIDYPWFAKREFMEYLDHVGLGHVPRLTRIEWGVIRSSLGRPRRFSEQFLIEEKTKLNQYRDSVRKHYAELLAGTRVGPPTDMARPLIVGQRVIAIHPKTREIHNGSIQTVDNCGCRVQFDQPELGVEFVMDIDCMPLNSKLNLPDSLQRLNLIPKLNENLIGLVLNGKQQEGKIEEHRILSPGENSDNIEALYIPPSTQGINSLSKQGISLSSKSQANVSCSEIGNAQVSVSSQACYLEHAQSKKASILAVSELTRALEKKELALSELKRLNDDASESQKYGDNSLKDSEPFKRHYAAVLLQLNEVNEQVSSALFCLRQCNTYQGSSSILSLKPMANSDDPGGQASSSNCSACHNQDLKSHIAEIVDSSRTKARTMVVAAMQAMSSISKTENKVEGIEEAINFINNRLSADDLAAPAMQFMPTDSVHVTLASQDQLNSSKLNRLPNSHVEDPELKSSSDQNEVKIPSDLISHCLAMLLMIQKCTERQVPPGDVAHLLDSAVTSLQPFCSKNLPIYGEIQKCMGIIRNQILALIPT
ncbi:Protein ALWAYS EARLY 3 [Senna tora]|uniref:Protein ALWAYS EARLY 3 n=1 Tax=Senna tora TaxID=362788 RepID=A0A834SZL7_9FABA|nr:Protein ALWAYS EARLY 3 [Senna tora]